MNTTQCPACLSRHVQGDPWEMDCLDCGIWWQPAHPNNQPGSPTWGVEGPLVQGDPVAVATAGVEIVQALRDNLARPDGGGNSDVSDALQWDWAAFV